MENLFLAPQPQGPQSNTHTEGSVKPRNGSPKHVLPPHCCDFTNDVILFQVISNSILSAKNFSRPRGDIVNRGSGSRVPTSVYSDTAVDHRVIQVPFNDSVTRKVKFETSITC